MHRATAELRHPGWKMPRSKSGTVRRASRCSTKTTYRWRRPPFFAKGRWWSASSGGTGDPTALKLSFDILTDLHLKTAEQFGLVFVLPDYLRALYKSFGSTLDRFHDEPEYRLPMPARYVIDREGIIRAADVNADYTVRPEPSETVRLLKTLRR